MELFLILIGLIILVFFLIGRRGGKKRLPYPIIKITIPSAPAPSFKYNNIKKVGADIVFNPDGLYPLTLIGISMGLGRLMQRFFIENVDGHTPEENILLLFMTQPLRIKEVELFLGGEYPALAETDVDTSPIKAYYYEDRASFFEFCGRLPGDDLLFYLTEMKYTNYVRILEKTDHLFLKYERLIKLGMAVRGEDIPLVCIISSLGRDRINAIGKKFNLRLKRRNIDSAKILNSYSEVVDYIRSQLNLDCCFMAKDVANSAVFWKYSACASSLASLFFTIYGSYWFRYRTIINAEEAMECGAIEGLEYKSLDCVFPECKRRDGKIYSVTEAQLLRFKLNCRCDLLPYNSKWK